MELKGLLLSGAALILGWFAINAMESQKMHLPMTSSAFAGMATESRSAKASATRGKGMPQDFVQSGYSGVHASGPIFVHDRSKAVFIADAVADWRPAREADAFGQIQLLNPVAGCDMPAPAQGARLVNLFVDGTGMKAGMYSFTESEVIDSVEDWLANIRRGTPKDIALWDKDPQFYVYDIVVSETAAPVHLVLQSRTEGVMQSKPQSLLFNLHLAEGVQISGVSILGGRANAVANIPKGVPVAVMPDDALLLCDLRIVDLDVGERLIKKKAANDSMFDEDEKAEAWDKLVGEIEAYNHWFQRQFGVRSDETVVGLNLARGALVGPVASTPEAAVKYSPLAGAYVVAQALDYLKVTGLHDWPAAYKDEVVKMATAAAGGDPAELARPKFQISGY